jgi:RNA ligase.
MRQLASIQKIKDIQPIPNADAIEVATVLGWKVVVRKGQYSIGDLVVYVEIDSLMPDKPEFDFLRDSKGVIRKIRTVKLRGQISQGIVFPLSILPFWSGNPGDYREGADVTEALEVTKYEPELPANLVGHKKSPYRYKYKWLPNWFYGIARKVLTQKQFKDYLCIFVDNGFPQFIPKTDETRVQVLQPLLTKYKGTKCYITEKVDGSSITIYLKDGKFGVCSRNVDLKEEPGNAFWDTVRELGIEEKMREYANSKVNWALQGELLGEGIQGNKLKLKGHTIRFFNVFDIDTQEYFGFQEFGTLITMLGLETVPVLTTNYILDDDIDSLVELAKGNSVITPQVKREGIVIRPLQEITDSELHCQLVRNRVSFKAINPEFLLKYSD